MIIFMENISIIFEIFKGRNFCFFAEKGVDSPNKIPAETVFRTDHENKFLQKVYFFQKLEKTCKVRLTEFTRAFSVTL